MPAKKKSSRSSSKSRGGSSRGDDAIALLKADHDKVLGLFEQFDKARTDERAETLAEQICAELKVHTAIEEEVFYPAARAATGDDDLLDEAAVEHAAAKELIAQIESGNAQEDKWCAKVTVLGEFVRHDVKEEQGELLPAVRKSDLDLKELGERLLTRKKELMNGRDQTRSQRGSESEVRQRSDSSLDPLR
jgi:hemerythrin superfamily protein